MTTNIHGTDIELTDALKGYVDEKIVQVAETLFPSAIHANVDIGKTTHHHNKGQIYYAEVNLQLPGEMVRVVCNADDLYKAIDEVKDELKLKLQKEKDKKRQKDKSGLREQKEYRPE